MALPHLFRLPSAEQAMQPKTEKYSYGNEQTTAGFETVRVYFRMPIYLINYISSTFVTFASSVRQFIKNNKEKYII